MGAAPKLCSEHESRLEVNGSTGIGAVARLITNRVLLHYEHGLLLSKKFIDKILSYSYTRMNYYKYLGNVVCKTLILNASNSVKTKRGCQTF